MTLAAISNFVMQIESTVLFGYKSAYSILGRLNILSERAFYNADKKNNTSFI